MRYLDLADALRARVAARDVGPGGALAGELELAREYGTSRVTVRRALDVLRREGLVTSRRGAGWFAVVDPVRQPLGRITTVEAAVEAAGARPGRQVVGFGFIDAPANVAEALRVADGSDVLRVQRVNLADGDPFALVTVWVRGDVGADVSRADVERAPLYDVLPVRGVQLASAHQSITAALASDEDARVLECAVGDALLVVRRITHDASGNPVLYSEHRYPAARTTFDIDFSLQPGALEHV